MNIFLARTISLFFSISLATLASPQVFDIQKSSRTVTIKNLTSENHMEMLVNIGNCGKKVMLGPQSSITLPLLKGKDNITVKSINLTPMRELMAQTKTPPQPLPQPTIDKKSIDSMQPVCLDL